jgi:prepilin-type N-terminal cleavage/methylation domain-containing protein
MIKRTNAFTPLEMYKVSSIDYGNALIRISRKKRFLSLTGFTLVELLVASSIFVVVMLTIYSAFHSGIFGYRNIEATIDTYQTARMVLERINLDLRNSFAYSQEESKFQGKNNELSFLTLVDSYQYQEDKIIQIQDYAFVSYQLETNKLMRLCRKNQEALKEEEKSEIQPEEMASGVDIEFEYGDIYTGPTGQQEIKFKKSWAVELADEKLADEKRVLPQAVRVNLTIKGKAEQNFARTIYLPSAD